MAMKPILLKGHDRPVTEVLFNHDGDLIFSASKDGSIQVWSSENGERLGTYEVPSSCNGISVNRESTRLISAHGNSTVDLWEVETGKKLFSYPHDVSVRAVQFSEGDKSFCSVTDPHLGFNPYIHVYPVATSRDDGPLKPSCQIEVKSGRVSKVIWGHHNQSLVTANEDGSIRIYDTERAVEIGNIKAHEKQVTSVQHDFFKILYISTSKDGTAKLWDSRTNNLIKTFEVGRPLNAGAISPLMNHVIVGGGESAMDVTTTSATSEQFKVRFYHSILCHELGSVLGHFGPVNCLDFSPDGKSFISGSEDGFLRLHFLDESYFTRTEELRAFK